MSLPDHSQKSTATAGVLMAIGGYGWWAVVTPLYYRVLDDVPVGELLAWRVLSGLPVLCVVFWCRGRMRHWLDTLRDRRVLGLLAVSAVLISINWVLFMWAVITNRLSEASLGYYINPLVSVALGVLFLGERMRPATWLAIVLAGGGVGVLTWRLGSLPWISLLLAMSFGLYGLARKRVRAGASEGLAVEMLLLCPIMLGVLWAEHADGGLSLATVPSWKGVLLLLGGGVTIVPLVLFTGGARRLTLSTVGLMQYIAPTGQLIIAVAVFGESFDAMQAVAFAFIWTAVTVYSIDSYRQAQRGTRADAESAGGIQCER